MITTITDVANMKHSIRRYIVDAGHNLTEGSSSDDEMFYIMEIIQRFHVRNAAEIGFNAGYSACAMLMANSNVQVTSFDIGSHKYVTTAKEFIDRTFPGRHTLILGNSLKTVTKYAELGPVTPFQFAFVDGGHSYSVAKADINNMKRCCVDGALVMMDDLTPWHKFGVGPARAWKEAIDEEIIRQVELFKDGWPVGVIEPPGTRAWALGQFT